MPNYVQLKLVRREMVTSPVTCVSVAYLFHRDFISSPAIDTSVETHKKDTISTSVELHGLDEARSLLIVTGHQNKHINAWIFDYELTEEINLKQLSDNKGKETATAPISSKIASTTTSSSSSSSSSTTTTSTTTPPKTSRFSFTTSRTPVSVIFEKKKKKTN